MKKALIFLVVIFLATPLFAETRHSFYESYDPAATRYRVYDSTGSSVVTGDVYAVTTYDKKTIIIACDNVTSTSIEYFIEGRIEGVSEGWATLDSGSVGKCGPGLCIPGG